MRNIQNKIKNIILKNLILFLTGYCVYLAIEITYRNQSDRLMGVIGGIILILLDKLNSRISWNMDLILQGIIGSIVVTLFELIIGLSRIYFNLSPIWDYSSLPFNYYGVICPLFSFLWIFLSIVGIWLADAINYYLLHEEPQPYYKIFGKEVLRFGKRTCK